jgi:hypothetical protein
MPEQRLLSQAEYIELTDHYAQGIALLLTAKGSEDSPGTAAYHAAEARAAIVALAEPDEAILTADFIDATINTVTRIEREAEVASLFAEFNSAVIRHLDQDLNDWLSSGGLRVSHWWRRGGNTIIEAANVFPPVTVLGSFAVSGAGEGTFTEGAEIDTTRYGGAQVALEVLEQATGVAAIDVSCTCRTAAGGTVTRTGQIPGESAAGTTVELGTAADRIVEVTAIEITGGTAGDAFCVETLEDERL